MSTVSDLREALRVAIRARDDAQLEVDETRAELDRALRLDSRPGTSEHAGPHVIQKSYGADRGE